MRNSRPAIVLRLQGLFRVPEDGRTESVMPDRHNHGQNPREPSRQTMSQDLAAMVLSAGLVSLLAFSLTRTRPVSGVPNGMDQAAAGSFAGGKAAAWPFQTGDVP